MKVLVTGAAGQLGSTIVREFSDRGANVVALTRTDLDICDAAGVQRVVARERPDVLINCAAYNNVDRAEDHAVEAMRANAAAVRDLALASAAAGSTLMHFSTDFVFDGAADRPYVEEDEPRPESAYGFSKLLGEWFAARAPRHYVLRLASVFGGDRAASRIDVIADALRRGEVPRVFVDRTVTPSYAPDVAAAAWQLIAAAAPSGVYHCVNGGEAAWFEVAEEIARLVHPGARVLPVRAADVTTRAKRPQRPALSNARLAALGIAMPRWQDALRRHLTDRMAPSNASHAVVE